MTKNFFGPNNDAEKIVFEREARIVDLEIQIKALTAERDALAEKLAKAASLSGFLQLMNYYAVEVVVYGATVSRLRNLEDAWTNLKTQATLAELKGQGDE